MLLRVFDTLIDTEVLSMDRITYLWICSIKVWKKPCYRVACFWYLNRRYIQIPRPRGGVAGGGVSYTWTAMSFKRKEWQNRCLFLKILFTWNIFAEDCWEPCQSSKMETFAKTVNDLKLLIRFAKNSILDVWQCS